MAISPSTSAPSNFAYSTTWPRKKNSAQNPMSTVPYTRKYPLVSPCIAQHIDPSNNHRDRLDAR
jgi:hypothetical protein